MLTKTGLRLGIAIPQVFHAGAIDRDLIREFVQRAEAAGYEDLWITENVHEGDLLEPVTLLAYAAACTRSIRLGVSVIILNLRNPVQLAKSLASLDQLSGGRLTAAFGLGDRGVYPNYGISPERPVARFTEALRVMRALWSEDRTTFDGEFWHLHDVPMRPKPLQTPCPPVWMGGHATGALRRAARLADGWMGAGAARIDDFYSEIPQVRSFLKEFGRDPATYTLSKRVYLAVDTDGQRARRRLESGLTTMYGRMREGVGVAGTPGQCLQMLRAIRDAGLQHLLLHPFGESLDELELVTAEVAPEL